MTFAEPRQQFYEEISQPENQIDLAKAALYIAREHQPYFNHLEYLQHLDRMAADVLERLEKPAYPMRIIKAINHYLYDELGFRGNRTEYYDPKNSFFNQVIDRRTGIPITMSLVYLEIAKRMDFPMVGIGMPGHFLIKPEFEDAGIYVDAFGRGEVLFPEDCELRLSEIYGQPMKLRPEFLNPIAPRQFLRRMLQNLKAIYMNVGEFEEALKVVERIVILSPDDIKEKRDRGLIYYQLYRWSEARCDLEDYLNHLPTAQDAGIIQQLLDRMDLDI
ncbi:MAG: transglutaminase-like domain-containing protein [Limnospira sp. PMC 894.15]|uniref:SirB1 family protein n=1 Tax=Limnospira sp. PMC 894.15 TaxID=2981100 RepID=UPI0028E14A17|nr:transglutaminase-like domain-containing protein [Limnospira sp. PMC 894.15]MDT9188077.1 transglutaminase-like domain-containing protein [Limnospira sp. PMC 894.15]